MTLPRTAPPASAPKRVRVPQAERSATMRARLAQAAFEVILDHGYVNFRTAAVARRAGVSQGAQLHHFPTKNSLALAAMEHAYAAATAASLRAAAALPPGADPLEALLDDAQAFFFSNYFRVALDILMAGGGDAELRDQLTGLTLAQRGQVERAWLEKLVDAGWPLTMAEDVQTMTMSLVRGQAVRALVDRKAHDNARLYARWREMVAHLRQSPR